MRIQLIHPPVYLNVHATDGDEKGKRRRIEALVNLESSSENGATPSARRIRAALPRGWVLEDDGRHARRDRRLFFRQSWILLFALVAFASVAVVFFWGALPHSLLGFARVLAMIALVLVVGGVAGPLISRSLQQRDK